MPQTLTTPDAWEFPRETIELIPLAVTLAGSATFDYTVACVPNDGTRPTSFAAPASAGADVGYLVNGPTLGAGSFAGYVKIDSNPEDPVLPAFTLTLK
jgi:hypothetical protein